jgi:acylphosphatase
MIARRLVIHGRVQGVGYRYAMIDAARGLDIAGWVRNRRDGTVEAFVQGDDGAVEAVVAWCRRGPPAAQVTTIDETPAPPDSALSGFVHRPTA